MPTDCCRLAARALGCICFVGRCLTKITRSDTSNKTVNYSWRNMDNDSMYMNHPELASAEELEDWDFDERSGRIPTFPASWTPIIPNLLSLAMPGAMGRSKWEKRSPALGLNEMNIRALEKHAENSALLGVQRRRIFDIIRSKMLQQLISCSGAGSVGDLCKILRAELTSGVPAPAPAWYVFSTITFGPRKVGYSCCCHRGCLVTESVTSSPFKKCSQCRVSWYCSEKCQELDWLARHKVVCNDAAESRRKHRNVSAMLQKFCDFSLTGNAPFSRSRSMTSAEIAHSISQRKAHLKREKLRAAQSEAPNALLCYTSSLAVSFNKRSFRIHSIVVARGLVSRTDLNGKECKVVGCYSEASDRWPVQFVHSGEEKLIKEKNLEQKLRDDRDGDDDYYVDDCAAAAADADGDDDGDDDDVDDDDDYDDYDNDHDDYDNDDDDCDDDDDDVDDYDDGDNHDADDYGGGGGDDDDDDYDE
jgi:hypothetical protein